MYEQKNDDRVMPLLCSQLVKKNMIYQIQIQVWIEMANVSNLYARSDIKNKLENNLLIKTESATFMA